MCDYLFPNRYVICYIRHGTHSMFCVLCYIASWCFTCFHGTCFVVYVLLYSLRALSSSLWGFRFLCSMFCFILHISVFYVAFAMFYRASSMVRVLFHIFYVIDLRLYMPEFLCVTFDVPKVSCRLHVFCFTFSIIYDLCSISYVILRSLCMYVCDATWLMFYFIFHLFCCNSQCFMMFS